MDPTPTQIIERLGGLTAVATLCECTPQSVFEWKQGIPNARLLYLKAVRPDAFEPIKEELTTAKA